MPAGATGAAGAWGKGCGRQEDCNPETGGKEEGGTGLHAGSPEQGAQQSWPGIRLFQF